MSPTKVESERIRRILLVQRARAHPYGSNNTAGAETPLPLRSGFQSRAGSGAVRTHARGRMHLQRKVHE